MWDQCMLECITDKTFVYRHLVIDIASVEVQRNRARGVWQIP